MKNKIIIFLALVVIFAPASSQSMPVPTANVTVIVNTQGADAPFHFNLQNVQAFDLQTSNLSASKTITILGPYGSYSLAQNNVSGLKIGSIFCASNNPSEVFFYQPDSVIFSPKPFENIICTFNNIKSTTPVLIVPGLLGTEMKNGNELLWADVARMVNPLNSDNFMDALSFNSILMPSEPTVYTYNILGSKNIGPIKYDYYDGIVAEFTGQGYIENQDLFTFPYDWRYGASGKYNDGKTNADLLAKKIQDILTQTGASKVDVIAHSLGGLIVKSYAMNHPADNHIGKAVFVGVPNTGAPKAIKVLVQGDNLDVPGLNDQEIKKISQNMPAVYDLLPTQKYFNVKGSFVSQIDFTSGQPIEKDLNYAESKSFLTGDHGLNSQALTNSGNLHTQAFDDFNLSSAGISLYAIDGCKSGTITRLIETKTKTPLGINSIGYATVEYNAGDNTVPLESATNLPIDQNNKYYALVSDHGKMPSEDGIRQEIVNLISGSNLNTGKDFWGNDLITQDISKCSLNGKAISVFSPVNIFVTDQNGNRLGLADDGNVINEIPNADFEILGDHKFIYLPQDSGQIYNINMQGTDAGTYTIKSQDINNSQITNTEVFSNLPVTTSLTGNVNINNADGTTSLAVKQTPASQEQVILPSATVDAASSEDVLPPVSVATLSGTAGQTNFYRSEVAINIKATDGLSGVLNVEYKLDGDDYRTVSGEVVNFSVSKEGKHVLAFFATDKAGNNEPEQTINFVIDKTAPEVMIQFDQNVKDLKFTGTDNISDASLVLVKDSDDTITLTDQAGNITEIKLKDKNRKITMSGEIKSLKYNGVATDISKNLMAFVWLYDKNKNLKALFQYVQSKKNYNILAVYDGKNTKLIGKDSSGIILKSLGGLKVLKIATTKGDFNWSY